jgi:hypothetical protein
LIRPFLRRISLGGCALLGLAAHGVAQTPDLRHSIDLSLSLRGGGGEPSAIRAYNMWGRHSTVSLIIFLEPGFRAFVSQPIQRIPNDPDRQPLLEYYVEDPGLWRVGKQFLPFGGGQMLRESVMAARGDTTYLLGGTPISVALCDGGPSRQRGVVGRIGGRLGGSVAIGSNFGIAGTALTTYRRPEESPGAGRGWGLAVGVDLVERAGPLTYRFEAIGLRNGASTLDEDLTLVDLSATYQRVPSQAITVGWTRGFPDGADVFRATGSFRLSNNLWLEPGVKVRDQRRVDVGIEVRLRF